MAASSDRRHRQGDKDWQVNAGYNTSRYLLNAAYMRMKNLMVSYSLGGRALGKLRLQDLRFYVSCDNLFTINALPSAFDPETINIVNTWAGGSREAAPGLTSVLTQNGNAKVYPLSRTHGNRSRHHFLTSAHYEDIQIYTDNCSSCIACRM